MEIVEPQVPQKRNVKFGNVYTRDMKTLSQSPVQPIGLTGSYPVPGAADIKNLGPLHQIEDLIDAHKWECSLPWSETVGGEVRLGTGTRSALPSPNRIRSRKVCQPSGPRSEE